MKPSLCSAFALALTGYSLVVVEPNKTINVPVTAGNATIALPAVGVLVKQPADPFGSASADLPDPI